MNRRQFLQATTAGLALSSMGSFVPAFAQPKPKRVALIGTGWYGKSTCSGCSRLHRSKWSRCATWIETW